MQRTWVLRAVVLFLVLMLAACPRSSTAGADAGTVGRSITGTGGKAAVPSPYTPDLIPGAGKCAHDSDCDDGVFCNGDELCIPIDEHANLAGCVRPLPIRCVPVHQDCNEELARCDRHPTARVVMTDCVNAPDADLDGHASLACGGDDCFDDDATRYTDDLDGDGHRSTACGGDDCDDLDASRYPGNSETCDDRGHDEDCDPATLGPDPYRTGDMDGFYPTSCCNTQPDGELLCGSDCDDTRSQISVTGVESCNGVDDDCDGNIDEDVSQAMYVDRDGDGWGKGTAQDRCPGTVGYATVSGDCADGDPTVHPGQVDVCNGVDDDCDGTVDEGVSVTLYLDADRDGYGDPASSITGCPGADGYSELDGDCDDNNAAIVPGAIVCGSPQTPAQIKICRSVVVSGVPAGGPGTYEMSTCAAQQACHAQPNGTGVCF